MLKNCRPALLALALSFYVPVVSVAVELREVCSNTRCFQSEVMGTPQGRALGLMSRESLADDEAMLFVFDEPGEYTFWMKNMNFPIDIIWLDQDKRVVYCALNVPPCSQDPCPVYAPQVKALYVLEVAAGQADAGRIHSGDRLLWN